MKINKTINVRSAKLVFEKFTDLFGKFKTNYHFKTKEQQRRALKEWAIELNKLDENEINRGIRNLRKSGKTWPPCLQEFLIMCESHGGGVMVEQEKKVNIKQTPEVVRSEIAKARSLLGNRGQSRASAG